MIVDLPSTTTTQVSKRLVQLRNDVGAMAMGRVLTLIILVDEDGADAAVQAANDATRQHPARILVLARGNRRGADRLDAQIRVGGDAGASEIVVLRLYGRLADHGHSVATPLLLPDSPIVAWWPRDPPADVADTPIGVLAHRRITDAAACARPGTELRRRARHYRPGDTDLSWTRITRWRGVLAAALDQPPYEELQGAAVTGEPDHPAADLLAGWLGWALDVPVARVHSGAGTGLVSVRLRRASGPVDLVLGEKDLATLSVPGQPVRQVPLVTHGLAEYLALELRRLDADEIYAAALTEGLGRLTRRTPARQEAVRRGLAPGRPPVPPTGTGTAVSTRALSRRRPPEDPPAPAVVDRRVQEGLSAGAAAEVRVHDDPETLAVAVAEAAAGVLRDAVAQRDVAHLVLTGGSIGARTVTALGAAGLSRTVWRRVHVWWGDERFVPAGDPDRNEVQAQEAGLGDLGVLARHVHRVPGATTGRDADEAADDYALELARHAPPVTDEHPVAVPAFDVLLLGVGPDGHVASLFPGRDEVAVTDRSTVPVADSPKPPPLRVSLTVPALRAARRVWFVVSGADKAAAVDAARDVRDDPALPATLVRGQQETVWWLDRAAAGQ